MDTINVTYRQQPPENNLLGCLPLVVSASSERVVSVPHPGYFAESETITDWPEYGKDRVKPASHVKRIGFSRLEQVDFTSKAALSAYDYPSLSAPQHYYAKYRKRGVQPHVDVVEAAVSRATFKVETGLTSQITSKLPVLPDRLGGVNAVLVRKLEQLHLVNAAWEARELPELLSLMRKRNLLRMPQGIAWLTGLSARKGRFAFWVQDVNKTITLRPSDLRRDMKYASKGFTTWLADHQLGYSFGLMPTIGDIRDIANSLKKGLKTRKQRVTATIAQHTERNLPLTSFYPNSGTIMRAGAEEKYMLDRVDGVRAELTPRGARRLNTFNQVVAATLGVNGATLLWNCVPFSWAIDIFLSLDDVMDNLWASSQQDYALEYWSTTKTKYELAIEAFTYSQEIGGARPGAAIFMEEYLGPLKSEYTHYSRVLRDQPSPLSGVRARPTVKSVYLTALVALGLAYGHRNTSVSTM